MTSNVVAPYAYVLYLHNASVQKGEINCHVRILGRAVISDIFSNNLPGVTVDDGKQICRSILSLYVHVLDVHLPHIIRFLGRNNGFHNPPGWTAVIVSIVEEIVLPHDAENRFSHALYVSVLLYNIIIIVFQFCDDAGQYP